MIHGLHGVGAPDGGLWDQAGAGDQVGAPDRDGVQDPDGDRDRDIDQDRDTWQAGVREATVLLVHVRDGVPTLNREETLQCIETLEIVSVVITDHPRV